jgi:transposase
MSAPAARTHESWELPDAVWAILEPLLPVRHATRGRHRTVDLHRIAAGVFFVLRTGIQWHALPREPYGPSSTVYYYFRQWQADGVFRKLWVQALEFYDFVEGIDWEWLSIDGALRKAPLGGEKKWAQSDRPREVRDEAQPVLGGRWDAAGNRDRGCKLPRPEAPHRDVGGDRHAATANHGGQAA